MYTLKDNRSSAQKYTGDIDRAMQGKVSMLEGMYPESAAEGNFVQVCRESLHFLDLDLTKGHRPSI